MTSATLSGTRLKSSLLNFAGAVALCAVQSTAFADDESSSPHTFSANVLIASEYVFRGLAQSNEDLALQGGVDYAHETSGFYVGFWASSIEFNAMTANTAQLETNIYGGFAGSFSNGINWDFGGLYYWYPEENESTGGGDYDFVEVYGSLGYAWEEVSYSPSLDAGVAYTPDFFGDDGDGVYVWSTFAFALPHDFAPYVTVGYQDVEGDVTTGAVGGFDYVHYSVGVAKDLGMFTFDLSWSDAGGDCENVIFGDEDPCEAVVFSVSSSW